MACAGGACLAAVVAPLARSAALPMYVVLAARQRRPTKLGLGWFPTLVRISQVRGAIQELDLEPQRNSILTRRFRDRNFSILFLEHFQKSRDCSEAADLLGFGFVFAQSQAALGMLLAQPRQNAKISRCRTATVFSQTL